jgi:large subunit ribosomal protein L5
MADEKEKPAKASKPSLTPEQEAEAAAKKAARAEAKAKGGKAGKGRGAAAAAEVAKERVKRDKPARLRTLYDKEIKPKLKDELKLSNVMQVPRLTKITINMGIGEAVTNPKLPRQRRRRAGRDHGPAPGGDEGQEVHRRVQAARRSEDRRHGDAAQGPDVRVPRSPRQLRAAARARLQGRLAEVVRRPRELHARHPRGDHLPEINFERLDKAKGMNITFNTTAANDDQSRALLRHFGMPFRT